MYKELLSPVGNMASLYQAIHNGADAVYLGGKKFGARMFSNNFTNNEIIQAIYDCHLYGVKVYVTVNTIVFEEEKQAFLDYIRFLYIHGVDAVIMQDIGMIAAVRNLFPELEIHASTQLHNYNAEGIKLLKDLGVSRVVLARELSLDDINKIDVKIEKEIFIHGALCVSFSGCCLFSSMNTNRSGNRGECVASCRLPYQLLKNESTIPAEGEYLLSTKELCTISSFQQIMESDVTSLKIEGRMKSPEYVGVVTRIYRTLMDRYYQGKTLTIDPAELETLKILFNREFTLGHLFKDKGSQLMNIKTPNHIGLPLGTVVDVDAKIIKIKLDRDLVQEDGIRFTVTGEGMIVNKLYNEQGLLTNRITKNNVAVIDNKIGLKCLSPVAITTSHALLKKLNCVPKKKIELSIEIIAKINEPLQLLAKDDLSHEVHIVGEQIIPAIKRPITKENIIAQISKLGDTPFQIKELKISCDSNIFIPLKALNEIRRDMTEQMIIERTKISEKRIGNYHEDKKIAIPMAPKLSILVRNEEQLQIALAQKVDAIYVTEYPVFVKYHQYSNVYYRTNRVATDFIALHNERVLATELGAIKKYSQENEVVSDYYLNIVNHDSIRLLKELGVKRITLSPELKSTFNICSQIETEMIIYGRLELMIIKYCPLNMIINQDNSKCHLCLSKDRFYLKDPHDHKYPLLHTNHITHIMHYKNIDLIHHINKYKQQGISYFRIELLDEDKNAIIKLINDVRGAFNE